ncbi:argininosuccinate synthase [Flavobacteriaceae bacterium]|jgi:argininosuccinate synthase|nr:argininosuccinate synthase [Flavobacteriaceae bacterium]MDB2342563.1 argininosuccinate synthase [Flavobacteriaceae bacterium]MDC1031093.1 argininosuccinate synthase [Flavobacteriaceae bacterium]MDC1056716.1 argininosuccinate synthase [Flavobacteriaceae bacterium]MDC3369181.1 argininosuccinate synthase [Flavobacteriaceae bacterium]
MKHSKLVLAYSGGLDTSYSLRKLSKEGYEVHAVSINTGGFSETEILDIEKKAYQMGAHLYKNIDALDSFYNKIVKYLVFGNVLRNNTYPLSVSAERIIQAVEIITYAKAIGAEYIAHGSTGAGNDQVRFDMIFQVLAPEIKIITLIRDHQLSREDEIEYLKTQGIDVPWEKAKYSINQGLWGTSVGGAETLTSDLPLPDSAYPSALKKEKEEQISLQFTQGELTAVNGKKGSPVVLIQTLEELAKQYAIGRDIHVGDTIIGIKGRVGFEAAAPSVIIKAHHLLEKHTLSKWQQFQKEQLANFYGMQLHEGHYLDPVMRDMEAFMESSQKQVTGTVFIKLHPYRFELLGIESPNDLMQAEFGSYGEMNKGWTADEAKGFIKLTSNATKIYQHLNNKK